LESPGPWTPCHYSTSRLAKKKIKQALSQSARAHASKAEHRSKKAPPNCHVQSQKQQMNLGLLLLCVSSVGRFISSFSRRCALPRGDGGGSIPTKDLPPQNGKQARRTTNRPPTHTKQQQQQQRTATDDDEDDPLFFWEMVVVRFDRLREDSLAWISVGWLADRLASMAGWQAGRQQQAD
jgi:hypothetical protein